MRITTGVTFGYLVTMIAAVGCGGTPKGFGIPDDATAQRMAQTVCTKAYECCTQTQLMGNQAAGSDQASCESMTSQNFKNLLAAISASQQKQRSTYDSSKVSACLEHIQATSCGDLDTTNHLSGVPGCDSFAIPRVAAGGACSNDWECIDGWCDTSGAQNGQDGICRMFAGAGQSCATSMCGKSAQCAANGDVCVTVGGTGASCSANVDCASGTCDTAPGATGTCAAPGPTACFYASGCAVGTCRPSPGSLLAAALVIALARGRKRRRRS